MKKKLILLLGLLVVIAACSTPSNTTLETLHIKKNEMESAQLHLSEIFEKVDYYPIETIDSMIIGEPVRIITCGDFIYIADRMSLYKLNAQGQLEASIKKRGGGPDEYLVITDFQIDENGTPWVLSRSNKTLYHFSWNGELLKKCDLNFWAQNIYYQNGVMLFH